MVDPISIGIYIKSAIEVAKLAMEFIDAADGMTEEEQAEAWTKTQAKFVESQERVEGAIARWRERHPEG